MPSNAVERRTTPSRIGPPLADLIVDALPLLMRARIVDAVLAAQTLAGSPVTSREARIARGDGHAVMRHARDFTTVAWAISRLGPDEHGRVLCAAGTDRKGLALWWVQESEPRALGEHGPEA